jgi:ribosomal protein S17E
VIEPQLLSPTRKRVNIHQPKEFRLKVSTRKSGAGILCALAAALLAQGQQLPTLTPPRAGFTFPQKQTLTYAVDWRVFPAGTAVLHFEENGGLERITANADTVGAINLLFHVSDRFQSTFDREKGCTTEFDKQTIEGRRQITSTLKLDYAQNKSILDEKNLVTKQTKHVEAAVPGCMTDLLSGIYYAASQPMEVGKSFVIPVVDAMHIVPVTMKVEGREEIKTSLGSFKTLRIQPTADAGVVKNRGNIWIWYTDDERHLPVQMRARLFWGTITFRLTGNESK